MITEDYISFETAKLLKEKGFDEGCERYYAIAESLNKKYTHLMYTEELIHNSEINGENINFPNWVCTAPTLQMAMKWLREKHNLFVFPFPQMNTNKFWVEIFQLSNNQEWENLYCESIDLQDYPLYEEAAEAAILYCLKNLI